MDAKSEQGSLLVMPRSCWLYSLGLFAQRLCSRTRLSDGAGVLDRADQVPSTAVATAAPPPRADSFHETEGAASCLEADFFADGRWGIWQAPAQQQHLARFCIGGKEVRGCFSTREEALAFQAEQLASRIGWPRQPFDVKPERSPTWDHPEELEDLKEYSFQAHDVTTNNVSKKKITQALSQEQVLQFDANGFLLGLPVLDVQELEDVRREFEELLSSRIDGAPSDDAKFRAAHTISRPLHQSLVARLAKHERIVATVENILGPRFVCWSAHLFCKLPGDPTEQPWHQDAGFWPLSQSRALTLWLAFDDVDHSNASVTFVEGSHRMGRLGWQPTDAAHHLLTQQIPDADLLGRAVHVELLAGQASIHSDLTVHSSSGNLSSRRRAGLALRFVGADAECLGPMINGYRMNAGCILPKGPASNPSGHWKALRRRPGGTRAPRFKK